MPTIGTLIVDIAANTSALKTGLDGARKDMSTFLGGTESAAKLAGKALGALGVGFGATQILGFISRSVDASAALHDLAQKSGATTETLSTLAFAGKRNNVTADDLSIAFRRLALTMGSLTRENKETVGAFRQLGLSSRDFAGLSVDQTFLKVAGAIARLPDGLQKSELATKLFGKAGADLIPLLNELGKKGFGTLAEEASKAGAVISTEAAKAADDFKDSLDNLKAATAGAARAIVSPLLPALTGLAKQVQALFTLTPRDVLRKELGLLALAAAQFTGNVVDLQRAFNDLRGPPPEFHARGLGLSLGLKTPPQDLTAEEIKAQVDAAAKARALEIANLTAIVGLQRETAADLDRLTKFRTSDLALLQRGNLALADRVRLEKEVSDISGVLGLGRLSSSNLGALTDPTRRGATVEQEAALRAAAGQGGLSSALTGVGGQGGRSPYREFLAQTATAAEQWRSAWRTAIEAGAQTMSNFFQRALEGGLKLKDFLRGLVGSIVSPFFALVGQQIAGAIGGAVGLPFPSQSVAAAGTRGDSLVDTPASTRAAARVQVNQTVNFSVNALDGASVAAMLRAQSGTIAGVVAQAASDAPSFARHLLAQGLR